MNRVGKSPCTAGVKKRTHELQSSGSIAYSPIAPTSSGRDNPGRCGAAEDKALIIGL
jgi:hypothetical protein